MLNEDINRGESDKIGHIYIYSIYMCVYISMYCIYIYTVDMYRVCIVRVRRIWGNTMTVVPNNRSRRDIEQVTDLFSPFIDFSQEGKFTY